MAEKKLHLAISGRKYDPGKKASKRKRTSDVKTSDPKPSTSQDKSASEQPAQDESISEQQPQDEPIPEQQPQDKPVPEQQDAPATKQQDKASDTLTSLSSDESIILPDYGQALKTFTTKDPSSVPKKPRYSLRLKPNIFNQFCLISLYRSKKETQAHSRKVHVIFKCAKNFLITRLL